MSFHSLASLGARHPIHNYEYADAAARTGASGFAATDVGKVAKQSDNNTYWILIATAPTWMEVSSGGELVLGRTVYVDKNQTIAVADGSFARPYATIEAGLAGAVALTPTAAAPVTVLVAPGNYTEVALTVPASTSLVGVGGSRVTTITTSVTTSPIVSLNTLSGARGLRLQGATGVGGSGISHASGGLADVWDIHVHDCTTGWVISGAGTMLRAFECFAMRMAGEAMTTGWSVQSGAKLRGHDIMTMGMSGMTLVTGVEVDGADSEAIIFGLMGQWCGDGVSISNTGEARIVTGSLFDCTNGLRIESTSGSLHAISVFVHDSVTLDLLIESATASYHGIACSIRQDITSIVDGAEVIALHQSEIHGDPGTLVLGELHVGTELRPAESCFGGGDSHTRGMEVFRNTNLEAGTWTDITTEMASDTGSTADAFSALTVGAAIYFGGNVAFPGLKINTTVAIVLGSGTLVWEFSDGVGGWIEMDVMATDSSSPYDAYAQDVFGRAAHEQIRFGDMTGFGSQSVNSSTKFWVRARIATASITTSPTLEQTKVHTNRTEINADGVIEHFGTGETLSSVGWALQHMEDLQGAGAGNNAINVSTNLQVGNNDNVFADAALDGIAGIYEIPKGIDTSRPLELVMDWISKSPGSGDVELETIEAPMQQGDTLNSSLPEVQQSQIIAASGTNVLVENVFNFDISDLVPGDLLAFSIFRDAQVGNLDDTMAGNINIVALDLRGTFWRR